MCVLTGKYHYYVKWLNPQWVYLSLNRKNQPWKFKICVDVIGKINNLYINLCEMSHVLLLHKFLCSCHLNKTPFIIRFYANTWIKLIKKLHNISTNVWRGHDTLFNRATYKAMYPYQRGLLLNEMRHFCRDNMSTFLFKHKIN